MHVFSQNNGVIRKIVIDAGHGGKDPGAVGKNSREKDITLSIALKTGSYIERNFPDVEVIYNAVDPNANIIFGNVFIYCFS